MQKRITKELFLKKIKKKDGNFSNYIFNFEINFTEREILDFELDFSNSIFQKKVNFIKTKFKKNVYFLHTIFKMEADFYSSTFCKDVNFKSAIFQEKTNFNLTNFSKDVIFNKTFFSKSIYFKKANFSGNTSFHHTVFLMKTDFSYANFSSNLLTSFISINSKDGYQTPPVLIFRNIFFNSLTTFNNVDLTKTIFQDSIIENIQFKSCIFPTIDGRNSFYIENSKIANLTLSDDLYQKIKSENINSLAFNKENKDFKKFCISDKIKIKNKKTNEESIYFIVTKFVFNSKDEMTKYFENLNKERNIIGGGKKINLEIIDKLQNKVLVFRLKEFNEEKHWEVLEDIYRQMKKSLEGLHDWQMAGDFYKGEMNAKMNLLRVQKKQSIFRKTLLFYKTISYFGESISRILFVIVVSWLFGLFLLILFKPELSLLESIRINLALYLPVFGDNKGTIEKLNLPTWKEIIIYFEVVWFYLMWAILAIAVRRRYRR